MSLKKNTLSPALTICGSLSKEHSLPQFDLLSFYLQTLFYLLSPLSCSFFLIGFGCHLSLTRSYEFSILFFLVFYPLQLLRCSTHTYIL